MALERVESVRQRGLDAGAVAVWIQTGRGVPFARALQPETRDPAPAPVELEHRTPHLGTAQPVIVDPEIAIDRALEDLDAGRDPRPKLHAAKLLIQAAKAMRSAGLALIVVSGQLLEPAQPFDPFLCDRSKKTSLPSRGLRFITGRRRRKV